MKKSVLFAVVLVGVLAVFAAVLPARAEDYCPGCVPAAQGKFVVRNLSGESIYVRLSGPTQYTLPVAAGETKYFTIAIGDYVYSASMCGTTRSDEFHQSRGKYTLTLRPCPPSYEQLSASETGEAKLVRVKIKNVCATTNSVTLTGNLGDTYHFVLGPGETGEYTIVGKYIQQIPMFNDNGVFLGSYKTQESIETYSVSCTTCGPVGTWTPVGSSHVLKVGVQK